MALKSSWKQNGSPATDRDLAEALALGRAHRKKQADAAREEQARDGDARAVGRSIRKSLSDHSRRRCSIGCRPAAVDGTRRGRVRLRRFELMAGLAHPTNFSGGSGRKSSFHFGLTGRGAGGHRRAKDRPYTRGEAIRSIRYILREAAREIERGGVVSNISTDADIVAGLFAAIEELELTAGRENANVYMSLVISLPHELEAAARELLLAAICTPLAELGLSYVGVLHAPDPDGDQRNTHAHVMFSWRPFEDRGDGEYGFSVQTFGELNNASFVTKFRSHAADAMNEAMAAAGQARRFTPLSRAARGEAPPAEGGKLTVGQKHAMRRQEDIALAQVERRLNDERAAALTRVVAVTEAIITRRPSGRVAQLATLRAANDILVSGQSEREDAVRTSDARMSKVEVPVGDTAVSAATIALQPPVPASRQMATQAMPTTVSEAAGSKNGSSEATGTMPTDGTVGASGSTSVSHEKPVDTALTGIGPGVPAPSNRTLDAVMAVSTIPATGQAGSAAKDPSRKPTAATAPRPTEQSASDDATESSQAARVAQTSPSSPRLAPVDDTAKPLPHGPTSPATEPAAALDGVVIKGGDPAPRPRQPGAVSSRTTRGTAHGTDRANTGQPSPASSRIVKSRSAKTETSREAARERGASAGAAAASSTQTPPSQHARQRSARTEVLRAEARNRAVSLNNATASSGEQPLPNQLAQQPVAASKATQVDAGWERVLQSSGDSSLQIADDSAETKPNQPAKVPPPWIAPASSDPSQLIKKKPRRAAPTVVQAAATEPDHASPDATLIKKVEPTTSAEGSSAISDNLAAFWHDSKRGRNK